MSEGVRFQFMQHCVDVFHDKIYTCRITGKFAYFIINACDTVFYAKCYGETTFQFGCEQCVTGHYKESKVRSRFE